MLKESDFSVSFVESQFPPQAVEEEAGKDADHPVQFHAIWSYGEF
jgi:hypothetical protein